MSDEARRSGFREADVQHLALGLASVRPDLIPRHIDRLRGLAGRGPSALPHAEFIRLSPLVQLALRKAAQLQSSGQIAPEHLALALLDVVESDAQGGWRALDIDELWMRERASSSLETADISLSPSWGTANDFGVPAVTRLKAMGMPIEVRIGPGSPVGDLGNARTDARLLLGVLNVNGRAALLLREHGIDESEITSLVASDL